MDKKEVKVMKRGRQRGMKRGMKRGKQHGMKRLSRAIAALVVFAMVLTCVLTCVPARKAQAATKNEKSITVKLLGYETRVITFQSGIKSVKLYGDAKYAEVKKIASDKIEITGKQKGRRYFEVLTKDNKLTKCYGRVETVNYTKSNTYRIVKSKRKIEYIKSSNTGVVKTQLGKGQKTYLLKTTSRKGTSTITIIYSDGEMVKHKISTAAHQHKWVTVADRTKAKAIYKVKEYPVFIYLWPDGSNAFYLAGGSQKQRWCALHCIRCMGPDVLDPDPLGRCAWTVGEGIWMQDRTVRVGTKYTSITSHKECSLCGARR